MESNRQKHFKKGLKEGGRIAGLSFWTLMGIGVVEIFVGWWSGSVSATADGLDSISDAMISLVVWLGLRVSQKKEDKLFHFGYHKVETFAALMAAVGMVVIGALIAWHSVERLYVPYEVENPLVVMAVLGGAGAISLYRAFQMNKIANKYNLLSLKTDARNSIKDGSASIIGFVSVGIAALTGFHQADAIGGLIISVYIFTVAYFSLKSASLVLVDASYDKELAGRVKRQIETVFQVKVKSVMLRPVGPFFHCELGLKVHGGMQVAELKRLTRTIEGYVDKENFNISRVTVTPT
jgi:cation diffusion facilitator family transporter